METTHTNQAVLIANALSDHQGTWDSWGWGCQCGAGERMAPRGVGQEHGTTAGWSKATEAREALLLHQGDAVDAFLTRI